MLFRSLMFDGKIAEAAGNSSITMIGSGLAAFTTSFPLTTTMQSLGKIVTCGRDNAMMLYIFPPSAQNVEITVKDVMVFDLTQMFGSTIADYIYSLEQANAGAGVAWFKKLFPKPYYAYNTGELMSVKALRHKTVGFNQLPTTPTHGTESQIKGYEFNKNDCALLLKGQPYEYRFESITGATNWRFILKFFDVDGNLLVGSDSDTAITAGILSESSANLFWYSSREAFMNGSDTTTKYITFTPAVDCYVKPFFAAGNTSASSQMQDACIHLRWDGERDGEYEEYKEHIYELDPDLELRGIPKLTAGNDLYYDGDVYEPDGTVTRKYGVVDAGTLNWQYDSTNEFFYYLANSSATIHITVNSAFVCAKYAYGGYKTDAEMASVGAGVYSHGGYVYIKDSAYTDAATFKTAMNGVYLIYELAEPTEESADPYNGTQIVDDFGTEEFVDAEVAAEARDVAIPVGHNSLYQPNLRAKLEMVPEAPEDDGYYVVYHHDGINEYVPLIIPQELPELPTEDGTYTLKCTVASGSATLSFESEV